jgi:hypothetical protein
MEDMEDKEEYKEGFVFKEGDIKSDDISVCYCVTGLCIYYNYIEKELIVTIGEKYVNKIESDNSELIEEGELIEDDRLYVTQFRIYDFKEYYWLMIYDVNGDRHIRKEYGKDIIEAFIDNLPHNGVKSMVSKFREEVIKIGKH